MSTCNHYFIRDPFTKLFKCTHCNLETDGKDLKEWRK